MKTKKKRSSLQNELVFSPKVMDDRKKKGEKGLCLQISGFSVSKEKKEQMVSPQNGDTRGAPPPLLATPLNAHSKGSENPDKNILEFV